MQIKVVQNSQNVCSLWKEVSTNSIPVKEPGKGEPKKDKIEK